MNNQSDDRSKNDSFESILNAGIAGSESEIVNRFGSAIKEFHVSQSGIDNENGIRLKRSLEDISNYRSSSDVNIKQHAGFSAEVKSVSRENAERIISGEQSTTYTRTDDMTKQSDNHNNEIGGMNDQLYDVAQVDSNGLYVDGTGIQYKFVGSDPQDCCKKLISPKCDKYRENGVPLEVPSEYYDEIKIELEKRADKLKKQIENAKAKGNTELAQKHQEQLNRVEQTSKILKKSNVSSKEAVEACLNPPLSTAKDIIKTAHRSGLEGAKSGAIIGGGISFISHCIMVVKGEESTEEAIKGVTVDTAKVTALSYGTGFAGSALKGTLQNASSKFLQNIAKSNLPAYAVTAVVEVSKTMHRFMSGKINGTECIVELGDKGTGMVASTVGAAAGQAIIPIPVLGGLIGGMVGYALASGYYNSLIEVLKDEKLSHEERIAVESECDAVKSIRQEQLEILEYVQAQYFDRISNIYNDSLEEMYIAREDNDVDALINASNIATRTAGREPQFRSFSEFDDLIFRDEKILI
jgi:hypothetical protein